MRLLQLIAGLGLTAMLSACAVDKVPVDVSRADLMPDSVARAVVERYLGASWLGRPHVELGNCFRSGNLYMPLSGIKGSLYNPDDRSLFISNYADVEFACDYGWVRVTNVSIEQAREITTALVSLGAGIRPAR